MPREAEVQLHIEAERPEKAIALVAGVLAGGVGQLTHQRVANRLKLLEIGLGQTDHEGVGGHRPPVDTDRAAVVHLSYQPAAELDRPHRGLEDPRERALDNALQPSFDAA